MTFTCGVERELYCWFETIKAQGEAVDYTVRRRKTTVEDGRALVVPASGEDDTQFFALYAVLKDGEEQWVADFADYDDAAVFMLLRGEAGKGW